ncbi:MAG: PaaI family thioesterase [Candidatus Puniceispirillales bacterium WSBS_2018_MAG_OTU23]
MFEPRNPDYSSKINASFAKQSVMATFGMTLLKLTPGQVEIAMTKAKNMTQQQGFVHGGVLTTGLDSACGYAALTLAPENCEVLTVELKTSFFAPARQDKIIFIGTVLKPGRRAIFTEGEAFGINGDSRVLLAKISATMTYVELG